MRNIIFSVEAVGSILVACFSYRENLETGGILIGPQSKKNIVTDILPSSAYAERRSSTYYQTPKDVEILNAQLRRYQAMGYDFKGYYHKHPSGFYSLSGGDHASCLEILRSSNYKIDNHLIMCVITTTAHHDFPIFTYISCLEGEQLRVDRANIKIQPKRCIQEFIECFEEDQDENTSAGQGSSRIRRQRRSRTLRTLGIRQHHTDLPGEGKGPEEDRGVSTGQEEPDQHFTE